MFLDDQIGAQEKILFIENTTMTNGFTTFLLLNDHTTPRELLCLLLLQMQQSKRRTRATKVQLKNRYLDYCK